jgi:hypothetical protein
MSTQPTRKTLEVIASDRGVHVPAEYLERAAAAHAALRARVEELRAIDLTFIEHIEPADVIDWIEREGHSRNKAGGG